MLYSEQIKTARLLQVAVKSYIIVGFIESCHYSLALYIVCLHTPTRLLFGWRGVVGGLLLGAMSSCSFFPSPLGAIPDQEVLASAAGSTLRQEQNPWILTLTRVPENREKVTFTANNRSSNIDSPAGLARITVFKLRVESLDPRTSIPALLQQTAGQYSVDQQQSLLFYHMEKAGYLRVGKSKIRPVSAYVEMTTQRDRYLDIVFTFASRGVTVSDSPDIEFILDNVFFIPAPVHFALPDELLRADTF